MIVTSWHHWNQKAFESLSPERADTLEGEMKELNHTLEVITSKL